jgi:adenylate cyclase
VTLTFGLLLTWIGLSATVTPIRLVRAALADVGAGRLDRRVVVFDGTELGELQAGFNRMAQGLEEREQLRDLFGRHVGEEVAAAALKGTPQLGGEERQVAVFFIDLIGSTALAAARPPAEVVALLNRFFSVVVDEVEANGGFINKFEGDGALAVFGAPAPLDDPAGKALAAARCIQSRLAEELPECEAAIGVASGRAVAGNVGHERRFEYTVIGDPVNEAARLCELAKTEPGRLVASGAAVQAADEEEQKHWQTGGSVVLRGREEPTQLATVRPE